MNEVQQKLERLRGEMAAHGLSGIRLRGVDWFSWATGGGSNVVVLSLETGVAEVFVTADRAHIFTDKIEAPRLKDDKYYSDFSFVVFDWAGSHERDDFVRDLAKGERVASDRPQGDEVELPLSIQAAKLTMTDEEIVRYRLIGKAVGEAVGETLRKADPDWTEQELAGAGARALWARGLEPTLVLAGGTERGMRYRHPTPSTGRLGDRAMVGMCVRGFGLYVSLSRFVFFRKLTAAEKKWHEDIARVEAAALAQSQVGNTLATVFEALKRRYHELGYPDQHLLHHQGGLIGYQPREIIGDESTDFSLKPNSVVAWNPSVPEAKIEDTFVVGELGLENLTLTEDWPTREVEGRKRPIPLERT